MVGADEIVGSRLMGSGWGASKGDEEEEEARCALTLSRSQLPVTLQTTYSR